MKETKDIDLVVTPDLFEFCKQTGWEYHSAPNGKPVLNKGIVELYLDVNCGTFNPAFEELKDRAEMIDGINFCSLQDLMKFKKEYGREKDFLDLRRIETYLETK